MFCTDRTFLSLPKTHQAQNGITSTARSSGFLRVPVVFRDSTVLFPQANSSTRSFIFFQARACAVLPDQECNSYFPKGTGSHTKIIPGDFKLRTGNWFAWVTQEPRCQTEKWGNAKFSIKRKLLLSLGWKDTGIPRAQDQDRQLDPEIMEVVAGMSWSRRGGKP